MEDYLLRVEKINKSFKVNGHKKHAVKDLSFNLKKGETLAIVGESGCGKSTTGKMILKLLEADSGDIWFKGHNLRTISKKTMKSLRNQIQIVFQDPYGSLNPRMTVYKLLTEALSSNTKPKHIQAEVEALITTVGLSVEDLEKYPHMFSGGQRQRICLARAIASKPELIVCDEPVSALDLLVQAQILNLLKDIQDKYGFSYIFISHDLSVVRHMSDRVAIMYEGEIVEMNNKREIFENPQHAYTKLLLSSVLTIENGTEAINMTQVN